MTIIQYIFPFWRNHHRCDLLLAKPKFLLLLFLSTIFIFFYPASNSRADPLYDLQGRIRQLNLSHDYKQALSLSLQLEKAAASSQINHDSTVEGGNAAIVAHAINQQGFFQQLLGRFDLAEQSFIRSLALYRKILPERHLNIASVLNNLAFIYMSTGRDEEAEKLLKKSIATRQELLPPSDPQIAGSLNNLAKIYLGQERLDEAIRLQRKVLKMRRKVLGNNSPYIAQSLQNLAASLEHQGKFVKAYKLLEEALAIRKHAQARNHPETAGALNLIAQNMFRQKKYLLADRYFRQTLAMRYKSQPADHVDIASTLGDRAANLHQMSKFSSAASHYERALKIYRKSFSPNHSTIALMLAGMAETVLAQGKVEKALTLIREAVRIDATHTRIPPIARQHFTQMIEISWRASRSNRLQKDKSRLMDEALVAGQIAVPTSTSQAVSKMAARFAARQPDLQALVRQLEELEVQRTSKESELVKAFTGPNTRKTARAIRIRLNDLEKQIGALTHKVKRRFPTYFSLIRPTPLKVADIQKLLHPDEGFLKFFPGNNELFVWAITKQAAEWRRLPLTVAQLNAAIKLLRRPLARHERPEIVGLFDLRRSYRLFARLIKPVYPLIAKKRRLTIILSGELTTLPLQLLVTAPSSPQPSRPYRAFQQAQWLVRHHAVSVLPSANSLKSIRQLAAQSKAPKAFIGFGDPVFRGSKAARAQAVLSEADEEKAGPSWGGRQVDYDDLRLRLLRLEGTGEELRGIAQALQVPNGDILLRSKASERNIKGYDLSQYRILYFATHGLEPGLFKGQNEPSLVLTIPDRPDFQDNGLLTASEVAQLHLDADWVVLSACNSAAGNRQGGQALSGLARAFFFAGARALLVSHWNIDDQGTVDLMTRTFQLLHDQPGLPRSVALQRAAISFLNDPAHAKYADPFYWAAFSLIGG